MAPHLAPVTKPKGFMLKMGYWYTKKEFGRVPGPLSVFCARMPTAFPSFYGKVGKLDRKLSLSPQLTALVRERVASLNACGFCMDSNRWAAINKASVPPEKLNELPDYDTSSRFDGRERAALDFATEVTQEKACSRETFAELQRHFAEREICEITWLVASEHLYNINNVALNIGSAGMCDVQPAAREAS